MRSESLQYNTCLKDHLSFLIGMNIGDEALDLWETVHMQTMANMIHCKGEKTYRCSKITLQLTFF